jgi:hypothetical protein
MLLPDWLRVLAMTSSSITDPYTEDLELIHWCHTPGKTRPPASTLRSYAKLYSFNSVAMSGCFC